MSCQNCVQHETEILKLKQQLAKLGVSTDEAPKNVAPVPTQRPVVNCPAVEGSFRPDDLAVDVCVCFFEASGKDAGLLIHDGLARSGKRTSWISYEDTDNFDYQSVEKKIASNESLIQKSAVFIVSACTKYNIPVISVHDLASCTFPHPPLQPKQIEDSGIFQDKAITYVKEYFETVLHNTIKQIQSMTQKRNFCLCYPNTMSASELYLLTSQLQTTKYCKLPIQTDDIDSATYLNHIKHTVNSSNAVIYFLNTTFDDKNFLIGTIKAAIAAKTRLYFCHNGADTNTILSYLDKHELRPFMFSGMSWKTDGIVGKFKEGMFQFEHPPYYSTAVFDCAAFSGKWYYEVVVEFATLNQLGWANDLVTYSAEEAGIGDDSHSYAYDGSRATLFPKKAYGTTWKNGDIVGCMMDLDSQEISYSQNGHHFGTGISNFREKDMNGNYLAYFPGITMDRRSKISVNFGQTAFKYCPNGYKGIFEAVSLKFHSSNAIHEILKSETKYGNYNISVPRTRAFLSHKRSSAQGVAGRIWQELKNDYNVFLDSEAQFDLHDLKLLAKHTGLFIFILSEGILDSYWCLEELRSAIRHKRRVLILQDYQFQFPKEFSQELADVESFLKSSDKILYMAEFFADCIQQIRKRLGPSDTEVKANFKYLTTQTQNTILENSFDESPSFTIQESLPMPLRDYLNFMDQYFEFDTIKNIQYFGEKVQAAVHFTESDIDALTSRCPKIQTIELFSTESLTDRCLEMICERCPIHVLRLRGYLPLITTLAPISKLTSLVRTTLTGLDGNKMKEPVEFASKMDEICFFGDTLHDLAFSKLPDTVPFFWSDSPNLTKNGIIEMAKRLTSVEKWNLPHTTSVDDECLSQILLHCNKLQILDIRKCPVTPNCLVNAQSIPASLQRIVVPRNVHINMPGRKIEYFWPAQ